MQDIYDFFHDVNTHLRSKGLQRLDDMLRPANMSGIVTDMLTASIGKHARVLVPNTYHNGHPDLVVAGVYANNSVKAGEEGVEIKTTRKKGGAVDTHGARIQTMCVFVYVVDNESEPVEARRPMRFTEVYLGHVELEDFRKNPRGELGTRTATLHADGIAKLRRRLGLPRHIASYAAGSSRTGSAASFGIANFATSMYRGSSSTPMAS
jgi:hypothetical protein